MFLKFVSKLGWFFQRPNPFPKSIYENIAFIHRRDGVRDRKKLDEIVETSLKQAALWDQVKDNLINPHLPCPVDKHSAYVLQEHCQ